VHQSTVEVDIAKGPWEWFDVKANASIIQRHIVPWLIGIHGLSYAKTIKLGIIKQMIVVVCDEEHYLQCTMSDQQAADMFPLTLTDVARNVKYAAGVPLFCTCLRV
jgi:hypothetical protein